MGDTIKCVSDHAEDLGDGRTLPVGHLAPDVDSENVTVQRLLAEGKVIVVDDDTDGPRVEALAGRELRDRAAALGIEGRSSMSADQLRAAVADAEANNAGEEGDG